MPESGLGAECPKFSILASLGFLKSRFPVDPGHLAKHHRLPQDHPLGPLPFLDGCAVSGTGGSTSTGIVLAQIGRWLEEIRRKHQGQIVQWGGAPKMICSKKK